MTTKPTLKNSICLGIFLLSVALKTNGQQTAIPEICKKPPKGYELGGDFTSNPMVACYLKALGPAMITVSNAVAIDRGSEEYMFNYKDGDSLVFTKQRSFSVSKEGIYWSIQRGTFTENGVSRNVWTCKSTEVINTEVPELEYSTCGPETVNILLKDTPINRKHSGYIIDWENKGIATFKPTGFPYVISHKYSDAEVHYPKIQGFYTWNGVIACISHAYSLSPGILYSIARLESLNYGKEVKVQMKNGESGQAYYIQYKAKSATDWVESSTKIKRNTADTLATATISGLDPITQYCFRLVKMDTCNYPVSYSTEMCTPIVLSTEYTKASINVSPNPAEDKILINSSGTPVRFVELIDMKGRLIHKGELIDETLNISTYQKGKYVLRLYDTHRKLISSQNIVKW